MTGPATKERLRKEVLEMRRSRPFEEVFRLSSLAQKEFIKTSFFSSAKRIALYSSFRNEVHTDAVFKEAIRAGKEAFFPRVIRGSSPQLAFYRVKDLDELAPGSYDILEPLAGGCEVPSSLFDLVVVPGVAFDRTGARLGYGKGYYDRVLKGLKCPIVALAFDFQVLKEEIPGEAHDVRMDAVVTEKGIMVI